MIKDIDGRQRMAGKKLINIIYLGKEREIDKSTSKVATLPPLMTWTTPSSMALMQPSMPLTQMASHPCQLLTSELVFPLILHKSREQWWSNKLLFFKIICRGTAGSHLQLRLAGQGWRAKQHRRREKISWKRFDVGVGAPWAAVRGSQCVIWWGGQPEIGLNKSFLKYLNNKILKP